MKRNLGILVAVAFSVLLFTPVALSNSTVFAQTGYSISQVDHQIQVMYSGHVVILDTIYISGQVTDGFMIGLPYQYSADVLKGFAYDSTREYQLNLGVQMQSSKGTFYGAQVNFNGDAPSVFTVAFVLDNRLVTEQEDGSFTLNYPAYPSLIHDVATANVTLQFPSAAAGLLITKDDGNINTGSYTKNNLPAYTYSVGSANFKVATGTLQLATLSTLTRQITLDPTGKVTVSDNYQLSNDATSVLSSFVISLPISSQNVAISDGVGKPLGYSPSSSAGTSMRLANVSLTTFLSKGQSTTLVASYDLPSAVLQGSNYVLASFQIFPSLSYYVDQATATFSPPEGATIISPTAPELSDTTTLTRNTYQDTLTISETGLSYVDYLTPQPKTIQLTYNYNPVWVSLRPTFWAALVAAIGCVGAVIYRTRKPKEETYADRVDRLATQTTEQAHAKVNETKTSQHISREDIEHFLNTYEDKKQLTNELRSMDLRAQKGKIPRRQYKVQKQTVENRLQGLKRSIEKSKTRFRSSSGPYADLTKQLDLAEEDLAEAEENIQKLQEHQSKGEISLETYKRSIGDYQKQRDKAESAINGILLRLREKIR